MFKTEPVFYDEIIYAPAMRGTPAAWNGLQVLINVPFVVGLPQAQAVFDLEAPGFVPSITTAPSTVVFPGIVVSQNPFGIALAEGSTVYIVVSSGPGPGFTLWQALAVLANAGFVPNPVIAYAYSTTKPNNYVISQTPDAGTSISSNQSVQLTVSMGPPNPTTATHIPNVVGLPIITAQQILTAYNCAVGAIYWVENNLINPSIVISQSPSPGGPVENYTEVTLTVCAGPLITYPNTTPLVVPLVH